ncbi:kelch repeat and BTB domain-containing protein 8-like [Acanthaster planci]|uniref:Kelch repeat and BTB domain-containing protein 8-like n=1 Tax=Acanthaster planci TaxID=133434 RepID=A0A8B7ZGI5_ACAPL|nr:kelch repeat and BTB domain-containing protein 8-like [Acanthaster planci]XP_022104766.1 kelch repeat and BTB domain-containing protein 8-like [Acanthaster planci]XP_022104768.1 kelch repeat and BTB domain-containing protein 8-like [Acanthaster planci]
MMAGVETKTITSSKNCHDSLQALRTFQDSDVIRYADSNHSNMLLTGLSHLRREKLLTDVTLQVGREKFSCHRIVLAACSPYFKAMFTGGMQESTGSCSVVCLGDVEPLSLQLILDFVYTGAISLNNDNVQNVFSAANLLQVAPVVHFCAEYMEKNLHVMNCLDMYQLACTYSCANLKEAAWDFLNYHIQDVVNEPQVVHASIDVINDIVRSNQLNVASEDTVLKMVLTWLQWDLITRKVFMTGLLENVRLQHITHDSLHSMTTVDMEPEMMCAVQDAVKVCKEAFHSCKESNSSQQKLMQRLGMSAQEVLLLIGRSCTEHTLCCYHPPSQTSFFINLPPVCRTFGAKLVVTDANDIYVATDDYREKSIFRFNHIQAKWVEMSPMLQGRSNFAFVTVGGKLFALGGLNDWEILRSVEWYDPARDEWQFASSMPRDVIDFSAATCKNMIYVFSGSRTMRYDIHTDTWIATLPPMPTPRLQAACTTNGSEIWLIGGFLAQSSSEVPTVSVESFLPESNSWTKKEPLPSLLRFCSAVRYEAGSKLYLCGMWCGVHEMGLNIPMQLSSQFDLYDFDELTNCWADIAFDIPMQEVESCASARVFKR